MIDLSMSSGSITVPVIEILAGNDAFNQFFTIVFFFGGVSYYCGVLVDIIREGRRK